MFLTASSWAQQTPLRIALSLDASGSDGRDARSGRGYDPRSRSPTTRAALVGRTGEDATTAEVGKSGGIMHLALSEISPGMVRVVATIEGESSPLDTILTLSPQDVIVLRARGGKGGRGGQGGDGEGGADGDRGTDGGCGGDGGYGSSGAAGGNGGQIYLRVRQNQTHLLKHIRLDLSGGEGGAPGINGRGGRGGRSGRGNWNERDGRDGQGQVLSGSQGKNGSFLIELIQEDGSIQPWNPAPATSSALPQKAFPPQQSPELFLPHEA